MLDQTKGAMVDAITVFIVGCLVMWLIEGLNAYRERRRQEAALHRLYEISDELGLYDDEG